MKTTGGGVRILVKRSQVKKKNNASCPTFIQLFDTCLKKEKKKKNKCEGVG
jgi:hypothetical protein